jgi:hypothetical protein
MRKRTNPFAVVKAVDLTEEQIEQLWVSQTGKNKDAIFQPTSPVPLFLLGGKGSGKTHWMRYYSYHVQRIRHERTKQAVLEGIQGDGYLGIYIRLGSFNAERFSGRGQSEQLWQAVFNFYFELWVAQEFLRTIEEVVGAASIAAPIEAEIAAGILDLFDEIEFSGEQNLSAVRAHLSNLQKAIDIETNNVIFSGRLETKVLFSPGKLILGVPKILSAKIPELKNVLFSYNIDELENLSESQQRLINTLVRDRELPATFRIGGRTWGVKTYKTYADEEENKEGSEFTQVILDHVLREEKSRWEDFAYGLVEKRLEAAGLSTQQMSKAAVDRLFETPDLSWDSPFVFVRLGSPAEGTGVHFDAFKKDLDAGLRAGNVEGLQTDADVSDILNCVKVYRYPILEKINMLLVYRAWAKGDNLRTVSKQARDECATFLDTRVETAGYGRIVQQFGSDMLVQLFRQSERRQSTYYGMKSYVRMSEGLPRTLVVILKNIFSWSNYSEENSHAPVAASDQERGVLEASDWFMGELRKAGKEGSALRVGVERLARLFEVNRFADKPIECSLISFSVKESELSERTAKILNLAEKRVFLIRISHGAIDKNTQDRLSKFQLNAMLAPRSSLPIARRGIVKLSASELEIIFADERQDEFLALERAWRQKMNVPFSAYRKTPKATQGRNLDLFEAEG